MMLPRRRNRMTPRRRPVRSPGRKDRHILLMMSAHGKGFEADAHDVAAECLRVEKGLEKASANTHDVGQCDPRNTGLRS